MELRSASIHSQKKNCEGFPPCVPPGWKRIEVDGFLSGNVYVVQGRVERLRGEK
ncbi:MAG: hypothetical protein JJT78_04365 [Leptospira sp.]|nr:hypothetical protein [Leptospira sp.]